MKTDERESILNVGEGMRWLCESHVHAVFRLNPRALTGERLVYPALAQSFTQLIHMITLWILNLASESHQHVRQPAMGDPA